MINANCVDIIGENFLFHFHHFQVLADPSSIVAKHANFFLSWFPETRGNFRKVLIRVIYDGIPICMGIHLLDKDGRKEGEALTISLMAA